MNNESSNPQCVKDDEEQPFRFYLYLPYIINLYNLATLREVILLTVEVGVDRHYNEALGCTTYNFFIFLCKFKTILKTCKSNSIERTK
jgi:hypothetical protein